eukprot:PLAT6894.4.p1 GENE.PLAT6894.4~~PLAT6894.4.p1  ORF type:complete len:607 (+),score=207.69 PLAT6894.4:1016-2836(+)
MHGKLQRWWRHARLRRQRWQYRPANHPRMEGSDRPSTAASSVSRAGGGGGGGGDEPLEEERRRLARDVLRAEKQAVASRRQRKAAAERRGGRARPLRGGRRHASARAAAGMAAGGGSGEGERVRRRARAAGVFPSWLQSRKDFCETFAVKRAPLALQALRKAAEGRSRRELGAIERWLASLPVFHRVGQLKLRAMARVLSLCSFSHGERVFHADSGAEHYFVVLSGRIALRPRAETALKAGIVTHMQSAGQRAARRWQRRASRERLAAEREMARAATEEASGAGEAEEGGAAASAAAASSDGMATPVSARSAALSEASELLERAVGGGGGSSSSDGGDTVLLEAGDTFCGKDVALTRRGEAAVALCSTLLVSMDIAAFLTALREVQDAALLETTAFMMRVPLFRVWSKLRLRRLSSCLSPKRFAHGAALITQGEAVGEVMIIQNGCVRLCRRVQRQAGNRWPTARSGKRRRRVTCTAEEHEVGRLSSLDVLGAGCIVRHQPAPFTAIADGPVQALLLYRRMLLSLLADSDKQQLARGADLQGADLFAQRWHAHAYAPAAHATSLSPMQSRSSRGKRRRTPAAAGKAGQAAPRRLAVSVSLPKLTIG